MKQMKCASIIFMTKTYVIAGAAGQMALATAKILKENGHRVIGISTREGNALYDVCFRITQYDFASFPQIDDPVDGLVYFPGTINLKPFARITRQDFLDDYLVNSLGAAAFAQAYLKSLKISPSGSMVFVSSVAVAVGMPFHASVSMAKGAIEGLTKALAAELAPAIRVNCVAPSLTATPMAEKFINTPEKMESSQKRNPMKKIGRAQDIAHAIAFLLGDQASWISGQTLAVDGGMNHLKLV